MYEHVKITRVPTGARAYTESEMALAQLGKRLEPSNRVVLPLGYFPGTSIFVYLKPDEAPRLAPVAPRRVAPHATPVPSKAKEPALPPHLVGQPEWVIRALAGLAPATLEQAAQHLANV